MKNEVKETVLPQAGDSLVISKVHRGSDRQGRKVVRKVPETNSMVHVVYEDGRVRSKEGDVYIVALKHKATAKLRAQWVTVE